MIVSASYRTDIPAFHGDWFGRRLEAGWCDVANPYGGRSYRVALAGPALDGFVFWTRNAAPFQPILAEIARRGVPFVVQYTVTGYPRALERSVVGVDHAIADIRALRAAYGPRAVVWRYDPVLASDLTPDDWHRRQFARLAEALAGACDEVVVSWAQIYRKTARNLDRAAARQGFAWRDPDAEAKRAMLRELAAIAAERGMTAPLCSQSALLVDGLAPSRCIDAVRLSDVAGRPIAARTKGNRPGCQCAESRDIGAYDTCPHGCAYCYAVSDGARARAAFRARDPAVPMLGGGAAGDGG
ncbi:MAG: DUF1848 domain-containing protein [Inquilinus sp.]|nr:DUF1848 domain-containing protein [Inquilinus sp.]